MKNSFWQKFKAGVFTKAQFVTGVSIFVLISSAVIYAYDALTLHVFSSGQTISSVQVNENFAKINTAIGNLNKKFIVGLTTNLTINYPLNSGYVDIYDTVIIDASGHSYAYDLVTNNSFTIKEDGLYDINMVARATSSAYSPELRVMKGTSILTSLTGLYNSFSSNPAISGQKYYLSSGDVIYVQAYNWDSSSTGSFDLQSPVTKLVFEKID